MESSSASASVEPLECMCVEEDSDSVEPAMGISNFSFVVQIAIWLNLAAWWNYIEVDKTDSDQQVAAALLCHYTYVLTMVFVFVLCLSEALLVGNNQTLAEACAHLGVSPHFNLALAVVCGMTASVESSVYAVALGIESKAQVRWLWFCGAFMIMLPAVISITLYLNHAGDDRGGTKRPGLALLLLGHTISEARAQVPVTPRALVLLFTPPGLLTDVLPAVMLYFRVWQCKEAGFACYMYSADFVTAWFGIGIVKLFLVSIRAAYRDHAAARMRDQLSRTTIRSVLHYNFVLNLLPHVLRLALFAVHLLAINQIRPVMAPLVVVGVAMVAWTLSNVIKGSAWYAWYSVVGIWQYKPIF